MAYAYPRITDITSERLNTQLQEALQNSSIFAAAMQRYQQQMQDQNIYSSPYNASAAQAYMNQMNAQTILEGNLLVHSPSKHGMITHGGQKIERAVAKETYKAEFSLRRFLDKCMYLPIGFIDRLAALA